MPPNNAVSSCAIAKSLVTLAELTLLLHHSRAVQRYLGCNGRASVWHVHLQPRAHVPLYCVRVTVTVSWASCERKISTCGPCTLPDLHPRIEDNHRSARASSPAFLPPFCSIQCPPACGNSHINCVTLALKPCARQEWPLVHCRSNA